MSWEVIVNNTTKNQVFEVQCSNGDEKEIGSAEIGLINNPTNRDIEPGAEVQVKRPGGKQVFDGIVTSKPTISSNGTAITLELEDRRAKLANENVNRIWYQTDTGTMISDAITKRAEPQDRKLLFVGESTVDWTTSNVDEFRLADLPNTRLNEYGSDALFLGLDKGSSSDFSVKYTGVSNSLVVKNTLLSFDTRISANNIGGVFDLEVEFTDDSATSYVFDVELQSGSSTKEYQLNVQDATPDGGQLTNPGEIEYRFSIKDELAEPRGIVLDHARSKQVRLEDRAINVTANSVQATQRVTTRRFGGSVADMVKSLAVEDEFRGFIDSSNDMNYVPRGDTSTTLTIDDTSTLVVDYEINRDYKAVNNRTVVQGRGELQVTAEDTASQDKHQLGAQTQRVTDKGIVSTKDAVKRAEGEQDSWKNGLIKWIIGNSEYEDLRIGDEIDITWSIEGIDATHRVKSVGSNADGFTVVETVGYLE